MVERCFGPGAAESLFRLTTSVPRIARCVSTLSIERVYPDGSKVSLHTRQSPQAVARTSWIRRKIAPVVFQCPSDIPRPPRLAF